MLEFLSKIASGRLDSNSSNWDRFSEIFNTNPIFGRGFGSIAHSDFAYLEATYIGGLIGLVLFFFIYFYVFFISLLKMNKSYRTSTLLFFIWILEFIATIGAPSLTANRVSIILWILSTLIFINLSRNTEEDIQEN